MRTHSEKIIALVEALADTIEVRRDLDKTEKDIKKKIREIMGDELLLEAGKYAICLKERTRKDIDKDAIMHDHGVDFFKRYERPATYQVMEVLSLLKVGASNE